MTTILTYLAQPYKGLFGSQFILRTLAAHYSATRGTVEVKAFGPLDSEENYPRCALVLSAAAVSVRFDLVKITNSPNVQVERALSLWAGGAITLPMVLEAKYSKPGKGLTLPKVFSRVAGISESTAFNEANWGNVTHKYMDVVENRLRPSSFAKVITKAFDLVRATGASPTTDDGMHSINGGEPDVYAQIVDVSDGECKPKSYPTIAFY
jgi:hypothetical protein